VEKPCEIHPTKCLQRVNLLSCMADVSWGSHPELMLVLHRGLINFVGLMQSSHVQTVEMIAGVEPLRLRLRTDVSRGFHLITSLPQNEKLKGY
jgi:hypothetical protein